MHAYTHAYMHARMHTNTHTHAQVSKIIAIEQKLEAGKTLEQAVGEVKPASSSWF